MTISSENSHLEPSPQTHTFEKENRPSEVVADLLPAVPAAAEEEEEARATAAGAMWWRWRALRLRGRTSSRQAAAASEQAAGAPSQPPATIGMLLLTSLKNLLVHLSAGGSALALPRVPPCCCGCRWQSSCT